MEEWVEKRRCLIFKCLPLTPAALPLNLDFNGTQPVSVRASFAVSCNDRPHPDLLPRGEGTAIAGVSLRDCASGESSHWCLAVQGEGVRRIIRHYQYLPSVAKNHSSSSFTPCMRLSGQPARSQAFTNGSSAPSITACTSLDCSPVRRSFTMRYGWKT